MKHTFNIKTKFQGNFINWPKGFVCIIENGLKIILLNSENKLYENSF
jgi:hypothetical protein